MINIAELLKGCPKGTKLYSPLFGEVEFMEVGSDGFLRVHDTQLNGVRSFDFFGRYFYETFPDGECLLFPSKYCRTWEGWKLPVEPKFKVGDWIAYDDGSFTWSIKSVRDKNYYFYQGGSLPIKDIDEHYHLWTIQDAKDGDVLIDKSNGREGPFIFKETKPSNIKTDVLNPLTVLGYCGIGGAGFTKGSGWGDTANCTYYPATKEQRDLLFQKMSEAGYEWDADKKELHKIKSHYNISNFKAGMPVLVRDYDNSRWSYVQFSHYVEECRMKFNACGIPYIQCIPFDGNEHLLGTTKPCSEEYINW